LIARCLSLVGYTPARLFAPSAARYSRFDEISEGAGIDDLASRVAPDGAVIP